MSVLKKSLKIFKKTVLLLVFLNATFFTTSFFLFYFVAQKIREQVLYIYAFAPELQNLESVTEAPSMADLEKLNVVMSAIQDSYKMILTITIAAIIIFFLLLCFFQSIQWNIAFKSLKKKIKLEMIFDNYVRYALKFLSITLPAFLITVPLAYSLLMNMRTYIVSMVVEMYNLSYGLTQEPSLIKIILILALIFMVSYLTMLSYIMFNKYNFCKALKKSVKLSFRKFYVFFPIHFLILLLIIPILYLDSYLAGFFNFKIVTVVVGLVYLVIIAYYQVLMNVLLEKA